MKILKIVLGVIAILVIAFFIRLFMLGGQSQSMQVTLGDSNNGFLTLCPDKPNCFSSSEKNNSERKFPLFSYNTNPISKLKEVLLERGYKIESERDNYIHATIKSEIFGFVDDFEGLYIVDHRMLHFRSASRVGYSDMGVNLRNLTEVSEELKKRMTSEK